MALFRSAPNLFNARLKYFPDPETGKYIADSLIVFDRQMFNPQHWEETTFAPVHKLQKEPDISDTCENVNIIGDDFVEVLPDGEAEGQTDRKNSQRRSFSRAKTAAYDYLMCNPDCKMFLTLTFDQSQVDRYSYEEILKRLNRWLDNRVRRHGLKYVLIPEYHKDKAVHFHGIANRDGLRLADSGLVRSGKRNCPREMHPNAPTIYNVEDFPYGFTTAIEASGSDSTVKVAKYIFKYLTKSGGEKIGGRYYLHGGKLARPMYEYFNIGYNDIPAPTYDIAPSVSFKRISRDDLLTVSSLLNGAERARGCVPAGAASGRDLGAL